MDVQTWIGISCLVGIIGGIVLSKIFRHGAKTSDYTAEYFNKRIEDLLR